MSFAAGTPSWLISLLSVSVGFVLGILGKPLEWHVMSGFRARQARRNIYADLALYFARFDRMSAEGIDPENAAIVLGVTDFPVYEHYKAQEYELFLRIPEWQGLKMLVGSIRYQAGILRDGHRTQNDLALFYREVQNALNQGYVSRDLDKKLLEQLRGKQLSRLQRIK